MSDIIRIPALWELDTIPDACAKLAKQTGRDLEADMLEDSYSGDLPAGGCWDLVAEPRGNLENARALGREASVDWDDVAKWLRKRGCRVEQGKWIDFCDALEHLQQRISPPPTAAELETWLLDGELIAYVGRDANRAYHSDQKWLNTPDADERRGRLWLDSLDVDGFEPTDRWLTVEQLAQRWGISVPRVVSRLRDFSGYFVTWPTNGNCPPVSMDDAPFEAMVVALERVEAVEKAQGWTPIEPPAQVAEGAANVVTMPAQPRRESERRSRDTWTSVMRLAIQSALNEWERRKRGDADVFQFVCDCLEKDDRFDSKPTDSGVVWSYPLAAGGYKEIKDASLCRNIRREMDRRAKQRESDTVRTAGHCGG